MRMAISRFFTLVALLVSGLLAGCGGSCLGCGGGGAGGGAGGGTEPPPGAPPQPVVLQTFAYVADRGTEFVWIYRIEDSGALTSVGSVQAGERVVQVAIHPSNRFAYAVNRNDNNISGYTIDSGTGLLTGRVDVATGISPRQMRFHPSGNFAYVTNFIDGTVSVFTVDTSTGALTSHPAGPVAVGAEPSGIMVDPAGGFVFVESAAGVSSYAIAASGALSLNDTEPLAVSLDDIALAPSGRFLYAAAADGTVSMHPIDGTGRVGAGTAFTVGGIGEQSVYVEPRGRFAYVTNSGNNSVAAFGLHPQTGALIPANTVQPGVDPRSVAMGPTGEYLYATTEDDQTITTYAVNQTTGALTPVRALVVENSFLGGIAIATLAR